ncbi:hypothetical protein P8452_25521 [Trifolium repens]|nr:hypothetical protein P8452_25521 [Trifolium repens]
MIFISLFFVAANAINPVSFLVTNHPISPINCKNFLDCPYDMCERYFEPKSTNSNPVYRCFIDFDCPREMCPGHMERPECMRTICKCIQWVPKRN